MKIKFSLIKDILGYTFGVIASIFLIVMPVFCFFQCINETTDEKIAYNNKWNKEKTVYEITFDNYSKDTIEVYANRIEWIDIVDFWGAHTDRYLEYTPYRIYNINDHLIDNNRIKIYNVIRFKKLWEIYQEK